MGTTAPIRIAIVEDDASVRRTLQLIISHADGLQADGIYEDAESALRGVPIVQPQVVLMDILLPGMSGIECTRRLKIVCPGAKILIVTGLAELDTFWEAVQAGADGFLTKPILVSELQTAIHGVLLSVHPVSPRISGKLSWWIAPPPNSLPAKEQLSHRDMEIVALAADGFGDKQIADVLGLRLVTIVWHWTRIFHKLNIHSRGAAISIWLKRSQTSTKSANPEDRHEA